MNKTLAALFLTSLFLIGCSNRAIYENVQIQERNDCLKEPQPQYEKCLERVNKTYQEYEQERKELLEE